MPTNPTRCQLSARDRKRFDRLPAEVRDVVVRVAETMQQTQELLDESRRLLGQVRPTGRRREAG